MNQPRITPVLMCGGSGTRLWPLSRQSYPKQFVPLLGDETLFGASISRVSGAGFAAPVIVTSADFRFIVTEELAKAGQRMGGQTGAEILIEPAPRNTAPALIAAALQIAARDPQALILALPSDHVIPDAARFRAAVAAAAPEAAAGRIVTFGIRPDRAETGYGWLELTAPPTADFAPISQPLARFVEKPDRATAEAMLASGRYLWNAGIFLYRADRLIDEAARLAPVMLAKVREAVDKARPDLDFIRLDAAAWAAVPSDSIDYAIMERATGLSVVPFGGEWSDLGSWEALWRASPQDAGGTALTGPVLARDCTNSLLRSESPGLRLVGIGLTDMVAVAMADAVLVAPLDRAQEVKAVVAELKAQGAPQAETFPRDHRPWGWFESLVAGPQFQVKRIVVREGAALSLQSHQKRAEHWIVVEGTARVTVDDAVSLIAANQSVYIPLGSRHRLENPGPGLLTLIEVQTGSYFGEDDIVRYDDVYARGQGARG